MSLTLAELFKVEPAVPYAADCNTIYWGTYAPEIETALEGLELVSNSSQKIHFCD